MTTRRPWPHLALIVAIAAASVAVTLTRATASSHIDFNAGSGAFTATTVATFVPTPVYVAGSANACSVYTNYQATLDFGAGVVASIRSEPGHTWGEGPEGTFDEQLAGTTVPDCDPAAGAVISGSPTGPGFTATLTDGATTCDLTSGTYQRGRGLSGSPFQYTDSNSVVVDPPRELNIQYVFDVDGSCTLVGGASVTVNATVRRVDLGSVTLGAIAEGGDVADMFPPTSELYGAFVGGQTYVSFCGGLIAPPGCLLGPAAGAPEATTP